MYHCIPGNRRPSNVWWGRRCFPVAFFLLPKFNPGARGWSWLPGKVQYLKRRFWGYHSLPLSAMMTANCLPKSFLVTLFLFSLEIRFLFSINILTWLRCVFCSDKAIVFLPYMPLQHCQANLDLHWNKVWSITHSTKTSEKCSEGYRHY